MLFFFLHFLDLFGQWRKWPGMAPNAAREVFFRLIQTLPTCGATWIWILRILMFEILWIPNFWISRHPDLKNQRFPDATTAGAGQTLRSQPDPSPNATRDQIRRKEPLLRPTRDVFFHSFGLLDPNRAETRVLCTDHSTSSGPIVYADCIF